jgi:hypothetical protein
MTDTKDKLLKTIEELRIYRLDLTKEDLEKSYQQMKEQGFPDNARIRFIADLGGSTEIEYHYHLICKEWEEDKKLNLESSFEKHGKKGLDFLFRQIDKKQDDKLKINTVYLASKIISKSKNKDFYLPYCNLILPLLNSLLDIKDSVLRRKIIISIGWMGSENEIEILNRQLLNDKDPLCRAWSAASLMQMSYHRVGKKILQEKTKDVFIDAITVEKDIYAKGIKIEAAQTIFDKKWISSSAVENICSEKIEKAGKSAITFLNKIC